MVKSYILTLRTLSEIRMEFLLCFGRVSQGTVLLFCITEFDMADKTLLK